MVHANDVLAGGACIPDLWNHKSSNLTWVILCEIVHIKDPLLFFSSPPIDFADTSCGGMAAFAMYTGQCARQIERAGIPGDMTTSEAPDTLAAKGPKVQRLGGQGRWRDARPEDY